MKIVGSTTRMFLVHRTTLLLAAILFTSISLLLTYTYSPDSCPRVIPRISWRLAASDQANSTLTPPWDMTIDFDGFDNNSGTSDGQYIVPNYVHFLRFSQDEIHFVDMICILAAFKHQRPDKLFIHSDMPAFRGKYWEYLMETAGFKEVLVIRYVEMPTEIFGQKLSGLFRAHHAGDVTRLRILMSYGGVFLDNDSYVVRSLDDFRRYEMTIGWRVPNTMGNMVLIAHKDARFLKLWLETYRGNYRPSKWYYNAGVRPTDHVLRKRPELVHRVENLLGVYSTIIRVFNQRWAVWRDYYAVHLMYRHQYLLKDLSPKATFPVRFNESNIKDYPITFQDMVRDVYPL